MIGSPAKAILRQIRGLFRPRSAETTTDQMLVQRYVVHNDEAAFATLVHRHAPLVLGVCQRLLHYEQDMEDVSQATILVLVRKARCVRNTASVGSWLYGVAYRIAKKVRAQAATRVQRERRVAVSASGQPASAGESDDLRRVLDDELRNVPEKYRVPLLLCYLEGRTQAEAADQLGWTPGTLRGRLDRGRALLQNRLRRRGLGTGVALGALASPQALEAEPLQISRILSPALHDGAPGVSDRVRELAEGALW